MIGVVRRDIATVLAGFTILMPLSGSVLGSSTETTRQAHSHKISQPTSLELSPQLSFQIKLHAFLLWASVGFLMPVGILIIRMSQRVECGQRLKILFYSHVILQIVAVLLAIVGAVLSVKNFENSFSNTHQRIGLALYALILIQPLTGFFRPRRAMKVRSIWYFVHWLLGIGISIAGIVNVYIGLHSYHKRTSRSVKLWISLFTAEVAAIVFIYLFQDRWDYMRKQGVILGKEQIAPADHETPPRIDKHKELGVLLRMVESQ